MAFSGSSYFAGIGTVFAAIAFGVACGSMVTTSVVQPPNRLERLKGDATGQSKRDSALRSGSSSAEQASTAKPVSQDAPPSPVVAAAPAGSAADPQPAQPSAAPAAAKAGAAATTQDHSAARDQPAPAPASASAPAPAAKSPAPSTAAKSEDAAPANNEHASTRSIDSSRQSSRRRWERRSLDDRKFSERRRHDQDQRQQDEASNVVQPMPRGRTVDEIVEPDDRSRFGTRPRHFGLFGDDDPPRRVDGPSPGFGFLFGD